MDKKIAYVLLVFALLFTPIAISAVSIIPMVFSVSLPEFILQVTNGTSVPLKGGEPVGTSPRPPV